MKIKKIPDFWRILRIFVSSGLSEKARTISLPLNGHWKAGQWVITAVEAEVVVWGGVAVFEVTCILEKRKKKKEIGDEKQNEKMWGVEI